MLHCRAHQCWCVLCQHITLLPACLCSCATPQGLAEHSEDPLHYIDVPYVKDNVPGAPAELNVSSNPWAINQGVATLRSSAALELDRARALRFVLVRRAASA